MASWLPWRRREIEQAKRAKEAAEARSEEVDKATQWVVERGKRNNLGPLFERALRGG